MCHERKILLLYAELLKDLTKHFGGLIRARKIVITGGAPTGRLGRVVVPILIPRSVVGGLLSGIGQYAVRGRQFLKLFRLRLASRTDGGKPILMSNNLKHANMSSNLFSRGKYSDVETVSITMPKNTKLCRTMRRAI